MTQQTELHSRSIVELTVMGKPELNEPWFDYASIGISADHIPDLIALMKNSDYHNSSDELQMWIPVHAWRALAQLRTVEMIPPFTDLLCEFQDDDWLREDCVAVVEMLGPRALPYWFEFLNQCESRDDIVAAVPIIEGLLKVGQTYPEARRPLVEDLTRRIEHYTNNDRDYNGFVINALGQLRAKNALPTIAAAYTNDAVNTFCGNWDGVVEAFQLPASARPADYLQ